MDWMLSPRSASKLVEQGRAVAEPLSFCPHLANDTRTLSFQPHPVLAAALARRLRFRLTPRRQLRRTGGGPARRTVYSAQRACTGELGKFQGSRQRLLTRGTWRHAGHVAPRGEIQVDDSTSWYSNIATRIQTSLNFCIQAGAAWPSAKSCAHRDAAQRSLAWLGCDPGAFAARTAPPPRTCDAGSCRRRRSAAGAGYWRSESGVPPCRCRWQWFPRPRRGAQFDGANDERA